MKNYRVPDQSSAIKILPIRSRSKGNTACIWLVAALLGFGLTTVRGSEPWLILQDCRYVQNPANDGDSFHVRVGRKRYVFRLYFVDAPETKADFADRMDEQAKYFGISIPQIVKVGEAARTFAERKLMQPFTVRTCKQYALGRSRKDRYYAFVQAGKADLGEELVANGLARLHGTASQAPGLSSPEREWEKLRRLEREAKDQKVGAWGANYGRLNVQARTRPEKPEDSFEAFFHPERVAAAQTAGALAPPVAPSADITKLNINTATQEELEKLPGIGPVLAGRIIAARPFESADALQKVKGIGAKKYEKLRPHFN